MSRCCLQTHIACIKGMADAVTVTETPEKQMRSKKTTTAVNQEVPRYYLRSDSCNDGFTIPLRYSQSATRCTYTNGCSASHVALSYSNQDSQCWNGPCGIVYHELDDKGSIISQPLHPQSLGDCHCPRNIWTRHTRGLILEDLPPTL